MRQCRLNFADNRYDCEAGIIGEHYATELIVTPPAIMPAEAVYRLCFEPGGLSEIILQTTDGAFSYPLPSAVTATPYCCVTLIGYVGSEQIYKSRMVRLHFSQTADGDSSIDLQQPGIVDEVNRNTAARHGHDNKSVIDLLTADDTGTLLYDGKVIGGGGSTAEDISYTLSEDVQTTFPDIELESDTVKSGLDVAMYYALAGMFAKYISCNLQSGSGETVSMDLQRILDGFVFPAMFKAHEHDNKSVLDLISAVDGKLQYNGSDVGLKGDKGADGKTPVKGTDYWTEADKAEIIDDIHPAYYIDLAGKYPNYTCPVAMDDIKAAYNSGYNLVCRCTLGVYTATLPLFVPMPVANTWIFSGSGALASMNFGAQSLTVAITADGVAAQQTFLDNKQLNITVGSTTYHYDGGSTVDVTVKAPVQLVTTAGNANIVDLSDNTEYRLADITTLTLNYPEGEFECWLKLTFAESGSITVTLPTGTKYIGNAPSFANGEIWEMSIKDGVVIAQKVGEGT